MLKTIEYRLADSSKGRVTYLVDQARKICVFSGVTRFGSTINYAVDIITSICKQEEIEPRSIDFFDLQTCLGYRKKPGKFAFDKIELKRRTNEIHVAFWAPATCPDDIKRIFSDQIQGKSMPVNQSASVIEKQHQCDCSYRPTADTANDSQWDEDD